jgi:hypothetical protein
MKTTLALFVLIATTGGSLCFADILAGPVTNAANGHIYYLLSQNNWTASEAEAIALHGHLATINDQAENDWVFQSFGSFAGVSRALWIGLNDSQTEGTFVWASGEDSSFTYWGVAQPDNGGLSQFREHFVHMWPPGPLPPDQVHDGFWNDFQDIDTVEGHPLNGVVEITPPAQPVLSIRVSEVELCWQTATNTWYELQYRSTLTTNQWLPLSTNWVSGDGTKFCTTDAVLAGSPQRFYRVSVTNSPPQ